MKKTQLIILAAGKGERFGGEIPKQFIKIAGKTIIEHTIEAISKSTYIDSIIIVINKEYYDYMNDLILKNHYEKVKKIIIGGSTRQESSYAGIVACDEDTDNILFHDAIRPFVSLEIIEQTVLALDKYQAVDVAIDCADTIIQIDDDRMISDIPKRKFLKRGQTPQGFKKEIIQKAYELFFSDGNLEVTDDCGIVRHYNLADIYVINGSEQNIKVTYQEDIYLADKLFQIHSMDGVNNVGNPSEVLKQLSGKVGIVIGCSSGIGKKITEILKDNKCIVYGSSRKYGCDVCDYESVSSFFEWVYKKEGRIDYIINTAGDLRVSKLECLELDAINSLIDVDYRGAIYVTKLAIPYLRETKGMLIHFTSSSYTRGRAMYSIYSSSKAAVVNFVQAVAEEVSDEGIRINVINPERTNTPLRTRNFGHEPVDTLLTSDRVAEITLKTLLMNYTGQVIDVRRK